MNVGMLWLDDDPEVDFARRVARAAAHYAEKYGRKATVCIVHPETAGDQPPTMGDMVLRVRPDVLRHHFWIGVEETAPAAV